MKEEGREGGGGREGGRDEALHVYSLCNHSNDKTKENGHKEREEA